MQSRSLTERITGQHGAAWQRHDRRGGGGRERAWQSVRRAGMTQNERTNGVIRLLFLSARQVITNLFNNYNETATFVVIFVSVAL